MDALFQETRCGCRSSAEEAAALKAAQPIQAQNYVPMHFAGDGAAWVFEAVATYYPQAILFREELQTWTYAPPQR